MVNRLVPTRPTKPGSCTKRRVLVEKTLLLSENERFSLTSKQPFVMGAVLDNPSKKSSRTSATSSSFTLVNMSGFQTANCTVPAGDSTGAKAVTVSRPLPLLPRKLVVAKSSARTGMMSKVMATHHRGTFMMTCRTVRFLPVFDNSSVKMNPDKAASDFLPRNFPVQNSACLPRFQT